MGSSILANLLRMASACSDILSVPTPSSAGRVYRTCVVRAPATCRLGFSRIETQIPLGKEKGSFYLTIERLTKIFPLAYPFLLR
ncbi:hypothetical protein F4818DRAFT_412482 [Hypoxylon cercidicola]|nr:hypothetical protein F4818DRAFT_412482 [Hypoxylon cercidicola]